MSIKNSTKIEYPPNLEQYLESKELAIMLTLGRSQQILSSS